MFAMNLFSSIYSVLEGDKNVNIKRYYRGKEPAGDYRDGTTADAAGDYGKRICLPQQWKDNQGLHAEKTFSFDTDGTGEREVDSFFARQEGRGDESDAKEI